MTTKNILVTGGGGFLGGAIVAKLVEQGGNQVTSFSRGFYPDLEALGVKQIQGNLADSNAVENACQGMDVIYNVAAKPGVWGSYESYYRANTLGTQNIVEACLKHKVSILVHTSSPSVVFDGTDMEGVDESVPYPKEFHTHYTKTKAMAEQYVVKAVSRGLNAIILRPHLIWGPKDNHLAPRILARAKKLVRVGHRANKVDTIYVDNAADAHLLAAEALEKNPELSGKIYFISNDEPISVWEMVNGILKAGGKPPVKKTLSHGTVRTVGAILEFIFKTFHLKGEPPMTRFVADELATAHWFDISAAKHDLGYVPAVSIEEGLKRLKAWLDTQG